jgi:uncharacterized membrane protein YdbT with pleckstrin-like domain
MSYIHRVLQPDERVLYMTCLHRRSYVPAIFLLVVAIGSAAVGTAASANDRLGLLATAAVILIMAAVTWIPAATRRSASQFIVTDRGVIVKRGLLGRRTVEMNRTKVESVDVDQSLMGRIMDYGTIVVRGTGGGLEPIRNIERPMRFRSYLTAVSAETR